MKVAFLHFWTLRLRRGVETLTLSLANELAKCDVTVSILTARQTQAPLIQPDPQVRVRQFPTFRYFEFATIAPMYALDLIRHRYDAVIAFFADFGEGWALRAARPFAHSNLFLYLTFPFESAPHRYHAYRQWGWDKLAAGILADASYTADRGQEFFQRSVRVLPSGTDPVRFQPDAARRAAARRELGLLDDEIVLLNVAALEARKGAWRVIEALPQIRLSCPKIRYLILGEGPEKERLTRRVGELGLRDKVIFAGTTNDLPRYYNAADIFVLLSDAEAGSVATLEAMASGLPVIVSSAGGFAEVVDEASGRILDISNPAEIISCILALAQDPELRKKLGDAGRGAIIEKYSWARIAAQLIQITGRL